MVLTGCNDRRGEDWDEMQMGSMAVGNATRFEPAALPGAARDKLTLLFDGTCGFCTRTVMWVQSKDTHGRIDIVPCQTVVANGAREVTAADCGTSIWTFTPAGERAGGAQAAAVVAAELIGHRWPITVAKLPVIKQSLDLGYRFIANNRHRLPGIKGMCAIGDSSCGS